MNERIVIKKCKLQPVSHAWIDSKGRHKKYIDHVIISFDGTPSALINIENFWQKGGNNKLYTLLNHEETIEGEFEFTWENEDD